MPSQKLRPVQKSAPGLLRLSAFACKLQLISSNKMRENLKREYENKSFFGWTAVTSANGGTVKFIFGKRAFK